MARRHIIVVDDMEEIDDVLRQFLQDDGFQVDCVTKGGQLRTALERAQVDLVILDLMLPDDDGLELAAHERRPVASREMTYRSPSRPMRSAKGLVWEHRSDGAPFAVGEFAASAPAGVSGIQSEPDAKHR
jgi:hypothetical protein